MKEEYTFYEVLGQGSFGKVVRAKEPSGRIVAIKMVELEDMDSDEILREIDLLSNIRSSFITALYSTRVYGSALWISMEYCGGGSCRSVLKCGRFTEDQASYILYNVLRALKYIHDQRMIHRDIKSANILLTENGLVKVADFGVGAQLSDSLPHRGSFMGTSHWMAPEIIRCASYNSAVDIWSVGIVAFELLTGNPPMILLSAKQAMYEILHRPAPQLLNSSGAKEPPSEYMKQFVSRCLVKLPTKRARVDELLADPLFTSLSKQPPPSLLRRIESWRGRQPPCRPSIVCPQDLTQVTNGDTWDFSVVAPSCGGPSNTMQSISEEPPALPEIFNVVIRTPFREMDRKARTPQRQQEIQNVYMELQKCDNICPGLINAWAQELYAAVEVEL